MDRIAVIIPCYNEAGTIGKVVRDFRSALPEAVVYVYDNNSLDETGKAAAESGAVVRQARQQGKGNVLRRMFREIDAACYLLVDGDDTYPAESAADMVRLVLEEQADMVIGDRLSGTYFQENKRRFHNFGNRLVRDAVCLLFQTKIEDIMTGYRAFSFEFVKTFPVLSRGFEIETEMTIHAVDKNMDVRSVPVRYRDRPTGSVSKLNTYRDGFRVLRMVARLYRTYRPMRYFSGISLILAALSILFFCPVLVEYLRSGVVARFPTLIVCGFTMAAALQSLFTGLTLQTILQKNRQDFEMHLHEAAREKNRLTARESVEGKEPEL